MNRLRILTLVWAAALSVACANQRDMDKATAPVSLGSPTMREGAIYTPMSVGSHGCLLYSVRIPGAQAPAALVYQDTEGQFSYDRPDQCVKQKGER